MIQGLERKEYIRKMKLECIDNVLERYNPNDPEAMFNGVPLMELSKEQLVKLILFWEKKYLDPSYIF